MSDAPTVPGRDGGGSGDRWIMHFTHVDNLPAILADAALACDRDARAGRTRVEVGDVAIKEARRRRPVPIEPGGCVGDYVPFYFGPRSPMLYRLGCDHRDGSDGRYPGGDRPLVYLVTTVRAVAAARLRWVATDGNAATATTRFCSDLTEIDGMIDWTLMSAAYWNNTSEDPDRQRRRMAELLVHRTVPLTVIRWLATYDDTVAGRVRAMLTGHPLGERVVVRPGWYYGYGRR